MVSLLAWPWSLATPLIALATLVGVLIVVLSPASASIFSAHPSFMSAAFVLLLPLGAVSYTADLGRRGNAAYPDRGARRVLHGTLNLLGGLCVLLGFLVAFVWKEAKGKKHFPWADPTSPSPTARSAHVVLGLIVVCGVVLQVIAGLYKLVALARDKARVARWHGRVGPVLLALGLVNIALAAYFNYAESSWTLLQTLSVGLGLALLAALLVTNMWAGTTKHLQVQLLADEDEEGEYTAAASGPGGRRASRASVGLPRGGLQ